MIRSSRIGLAHLTLALFALAILVKAAHVQLIEGDRWRNLAERQQMSATEIPAPRGEILDATRRVLAESRETVRLEITPREVNQRVKLRRALEKLGVNRSVIARAMDTSVKNVVVPGRFLRLDAAPAMALRGVYSYPSVTRSYAVSKGARGIVGHVDANNRAVDGLELSLDSILRGTPGSLTIVRDSKGQRRESPLARSVDPVKGNSVVLTIHADLQEIAETALADAVQKMNAEGGDIVILDPHTGEILAMASRRLDPRQTAASVLTEPFEPGSTAKPFMAAALLERGRVSDTDTIDTGNGELEINGRVIHDDHRIGRASLQQVLRWSSNIGIVKFSERLTPREQFETLRDFGFGTPTGVPFPSEASGLLRSPQNWSKQSANSLAMGYEFSATPLQLALAYAPFANGGELVEPALVREIIANDGTVLYKHSRRVVRRVLSKPVADKMRRMLLDVVDEGTALQAAIDNYLLAGKTGTPRATVRGRYVPGRNNPNFVGLFPGDDPQYVIVVKLTAPRSSVYAAQTAAPVTKAILEAAVAARDAALDRKRLASSMVGTQRAAPASPKKEAVQQAGDERPEAVVASGDRAEQRAAAPFVVTLPLTRPTPPPRVSRAVPDVRGLPLRDAVRSLHSAGFRVQLARGGNDRGATATFPAAGEVAQTGTLVRLLFHD